MSNQDTIRGTQLIVKACRLLNLFNRQQTELTLAELSTLAELNMATAHRICQALVLEGLLIKDAESGKYRLGYELIRLGELARQSNDLIRVGAPQVKALANQWKETIIIDTLDHNFEVIPVFSILSSHRLGINVNYDKKVLAHYLAAGKVLLADLPQQRLDDYLNKVLSFNMSQNTLGVDQINQILAETRQRGYATNIGEQESGFNAVAAAVRDVSGSVIAALSVGGPSTRLTPEVLPAVIESVIQTAEAFSADLGYSKF